MQTLPSQSSQKWQNSSSWKSSNGGKFYLSFSNLELRKVQWEGEKQENCDGNYLYLINNGKKKRTESCAFGRKTCEKGPIGVEIFQHFGGDGGAQQTKLFVVPEISLGRRYNEKMLDNVVIIIRGYVCMNPVPDWNTSLLMSSAEIRTTEPLAAIKDEILKIMSIRNFYNIWNNFASIILPLNFAGWSCLSRESIY